MKKKTANPKTRLLKRAAYRSLFPKEYFPAPYPITEKEVAHMIRSFGWLLYDIHDHLVETRKAPTLKELQNFKFCILDIFAAAENGAVVNCCRADQPSIEDLILEMRKIFSICAHIK